MTGSHNAATDVETLLMRYYETYNSENPDKLSELLSESVAVRPGGGVQNGRDAYLQTYRYMIDQFIDRMTPQRIEVDGTVAIVHITDVLTARADITDFMGMCLSAGQSMTLNLQGRYTVADGQIAEIDLTISKDC
ncbi:nuclear transport factor 2 family protein [Mycobacterium sherrisii]|uniref:nuclear transport factor 2 family protein n=1 Tax=Mycobacterium sherrisii TaxID=243061 RepID=UPI0039756EEF